MAPELPSREAAVRTLVAGPRRRGAGARLPRPRPGRDAPAAVGEPAASGAVETPAPSGPARATATMGRCRLFTDGASRGNPGEAGAGAVLCDAAGGELAARSAYLGRCTNNVAEYRALSSAWTRPGGSAARELDISLDSELIVRQLQGRYKVKLGPCCPCTDRCRSGWQVLTAGPWATCRDPPTPAPASLANRGIDEKHKR